MRRTTLPPTVSLPQLIAWQYGPDCTEAIGVLGIGKVKVHNMALPFDGEISRFFKEDAPESVRAAIETAGKRKVLSDSYPYDREISSGDYDDQIEALQREVVKLQADVMESG